MGPMHLASDYVHPYIDAGGRRARCRVRIYLPDDLPDTPMVVCSELPNNPGGSVTNAVEVIAAGGSCLDQTFPALKGGPLAQLRKRLGTEDARCGKVS